MRDRRVGTDQFAQRNTHAAKPNGEAGRGVPGKDRTRAGALQTGEQRGAADRIECHHRWHVEGLGERPAYRHRAVARAIEVHGHVAVEPGRPVVDQRFRMRKTFLEREAVDEWLERRSGRAQRPRHVDVALPIGLEQAGRADRSADRAGGVIRNHDRHRELGSEYRGAARRQPLQRRLHVAVERQLMNADAGPRSDRLLRQVRGKNRKILPRAGDRFALRGVGLVGIERPVRGKPVEHPVARGFRSTDVAIRTPRLRRLRQRHEQRGLGGGEPVRLLAEIRERRRAHALDVAAERRQREIERKDLVLGQRPLKRARVHDLAKLRLRTARRIALEQPRHLHGQRRTAGDDVPGNKQLTAGPDQRLPIDAVMQSEAPVLVGDKHREVARIDRLFLHRQPPAAFSRGEWAEQTAAPVERRPSMSGSPPDRGLAAGWRQCARPDGRARSPR